MGQLEINNRLSKIEGQIAGLSKMIQMGEEDSIKIVQQILAVKSALEKVGVLVLGQDLKRQQGDAEQFQKLVENLIKISSF